MKILVYPEGTREELGARRWVASYYLLKEEAMGKKEIDPFNDLELVCEPAPSRDKAVVLARAALAHHRNVYGDAQIQEEVVEWLDRGICGAWEPVGDPEYIE